VRSDRSECSHTHLGIDNGGRNEPDDQEGHNHLVVDRIAHFSVGDPALFVIDPLLFLSALNASYAVVFQYAASFGRQVVDFLRD